MTSCLAAHTDRGLTVCWALCCVQEFGHYSTDDELRGREDAPGDCPVCFDNPHRPVTLDCKHVFCEVCILEWLEKELTCPVCRAQVQYCSPMLHAVKTDAASTFPILV
jgi:hypothetical protein